MHYVHSSWRHLVHGVVTGGEDEFRPRLGRIRSKGGRAAKRYLGRLYGKMEKARPGIFAKRAGGRFSGERIGRGAGIGAAIASRHAFAGARSRRVAVKIRSVRLGGNGVAKARAHLSYIKRDGAGRNENGEKEKARLYGPDADKADGAAFLEEGKDDRHQFRIILSPEDAGDLADLDSYTRDCMAEAEKDLGTRLDWVAVNHYNTDHPHVHIVLRGKDEKGVDLVIARNYIAHGFRKRAEELATLELGPRRDLDIARAKMQETAKERWTGLDRELGDLGIEGAVELPRARTAYDRFRLKLLTARLRHLESMGLAERREDGWRLSPRHEAALREAGGRGDIIRSMGEALGERLAPARVRDFAGAFDKGGRLVGRVAGSGAADDSHEARFLAVEGADGNQWRVEAEFAPGAAPTVGAVVEVTTTTAEARPADRTIAAIAARHGGFYSDDLHEADDPSSGADYRQAHKRRLEALRRAGLVERKEDGSWRIPDDYLERAAGIEDTRSGARVRVLSWAALDRLAEAKAETFLDDALEGKHEFERVRSGFGDEIDDALDARRRFLLANGLAADSGAHLSVDRKSLREQESRTVAETGARLAKESGKAFAPSEGGRVEGVYLRPVEIAGRRYAMIERSKEFALVPWRPAVEARLGRSIRATRQSGGAWSFDWGRGRQTLGR